MQQQVVMPPSRGRTMCVYAAMLASFVVFDRPGDFSSARVDYDAAANALPAIRRAFDRSFWGWQDTLSESTDLCAGDGSSVAWRTSTPDCDRVARRTAGTASCSTRNELDASQTTSDRARVRNGLFYKYSHRWGYLRDNS